MVGFTCTKKISILMCNIAYIERLHAAVRYRLQIPETEQLRKK